MASITRTPGTTTAGYPDVTSIQRRWTQRIWRRALGSVVLTIGGGLGWLAAIGTSGSPFIVNFGAFLIWLCGVGLLMLATADLARYKGRRPGVWMKITAIVYLTTLTTCGYLPLIFLAVMPNLRLQEMLNLRLQEMSNKRQQTHGRRSGRDQDRSSPTGEDPHAHRPVTGQEAETKRRRPEWQARAHHMPEPRPRPRAEAPPDLSLVPLYDEWRSSLGDPRYVKKMLGTVLLRALRWLAHGLPLAVRALGLPLAVRALGLAVLHCLALALALVLALAVRAPGLALVLALGLALSVLGLVHPTLNRSGLGQAAPTPNASGTTALPASVDLSRYNPPVGYQGPVNSCAAWATDYYLRGWYAKRDGYYPLGGPDRAGGFEPMYTYSQLMKKGRNDGNGGTTMDDNLDLQMQQGVDTRADYSQSDFDYTSQPTARETTKAARYKIARYTYKDHGGTEMQTYIEGTLAHGDPVAIALTIYPEYMHVSAATKYVVYPPQPGEAIFDPHAVFAYKYDRTGLWIEDEWGTDWGRNGYAELSWSYVNQYVQEAVSIVPIRPPSGNLRVSVTPHPVPLGQSVSTR